MSVIPNPLFICRRFILWCHINSAYYNDRRKNTEWMKHEAPEICEIIYCWSSMISHNVIYTATNADHCEPEFKINTKSEHYILFATFDRTFAAIILWSPLIYFRCASIYHVIVKVTFEAN